MQDCSIRVQDYLKHQMHRTSPQTDQPNAGSLHLKMAAPLTNQSHLLGRTPQSMGRLRLLKTDDGSHYGRICYQFKSRYQEMPESLGHAIRPQLRRQSSRLRSARRVQAGFMDKARR